LNHSKLDPLNFACGHIGVLVVPGWGCSVYQRGETAKCWVKPDQLSVASHM